MPVVRKFCDLYGCSSHFPLIELSQLANPVMLPLGHASLLTKPEPTGSPTLMKNGIGDQNIRRETQEFH
jgi:hypothetical protein